MVNTSVLMSLAADIGYFASAVSSKKSTTGLGIRAITFLTFTFTFVPALVAILFFGVGPSLSSLNIILCAISGFFFALGMFWIYKTLHTEQLTNTMALGAIWPALLVILGIFFLGESISQIQMLAIILIFGGTAFIITTEGLKLNKGLLPALGANVSWGIYWIILSIVIQNNNSFAMPVLITRIVGMIIFAVVALSSLNYKKEIKNFVKKLTNKPSKKLQMLFILSLLVSLGDTSGDTIIAAVIQLKTAALAGAIVALNPVFVSIFAYFIYKDRLTKLQYGGFAAMIIGAVILSIS